MAESKKVTMGIAWSNTSESYTYQGVLMAAQQTDADIRCLEMVKADGLPYDEDNRLMDCTDEFGMLNQEVADAVKENGWRSSDVEKIMEGVDCVIVPGGWDLSQTLCNRNTRWDSLEKDRNFCGERDISDYLLISYCIEKDIPLLCICRGMQVLGVVCGGNLIQDIGLFFERQDLPYTCYHRDPEGKHFMSHDVKVTSTDSLIYRIMGEERIQAVPSWHHQTVREFEQTDLLVTGICDGDAVDVVEVIERPQNRFCLGLQYHPEVAVRKVMEGDSEYALYMTEEEALKPFHALVQAAKHE